MDTLKFLADNLAVILKNFLFFIGIVLAVDVFRSEFLNLITLIRFKREWFNNNDKFFAKRCVEEGDHNQGRDHIYLVNKKDKKIYRIVNSYTLNKLGYPRPARLDENKDEKNKKFYFTKKTVIHLNTKSRFVI